MALSWLLDTNVVSEMMRSQPDRRVVALLATIPRRHLGLASVTVWEVLNGIGQLEPGRQRTDLAERFHSVLFRMDDRVLDWTLADARLCADILEVRRRLGRPLDSQLPDAFLAATAVRHGLTIITRNTRDFEDTGARTVNPWDVVESKAGDRSSPGR